MWDKIVAWFNSKGGFSHVVATVFTLAVLAYGSVPAFQQLCMTVYNLMPGWAHQVLLAVLGLVMWYRNNQKVLPVEDQASKSASAGS